MLMSTERGRLMEADIKTGSSWFAGTEHSEIALKPARIAAIHREEMAGLPLDQRPVALAPFVVSQDAYWELLDAAKGLLRLLHRAMPQVGSDRSERMELLSVTTEDCPAFSDDEEFELRHAADMSRADVLITPSGPRFIEFNVSGAFEGLLDFQAHLDGWQRVREQAGQPAYLAVDPFPKFAALIRSVCNELGLPPAVVFAGTRRIEGRLAAQKYYLRKTALLRRHGIAAEQFEFEDLLAGIGLPHDLKKKLGIFDFTAHDAREEGYDLAPVWSALRQGFTLIPSQSSWFLHSKKLLALLSEGMEWMTAEDRALVDRYVPWTRTVSARSVSWRDAVYDLPDLIIDQQKNMVLKSATGDGGKGVAFGAATSETKWRQLVEEAVKTSNFVVQERVAAEPYAVDVMRTDEEIVGVNATAVVSPFIFGGVPSGCYVKFMQLDDPGVVSMSRGATTSCLVANP
jgi:hypothetical protein